MKEWFVYIVECSDGTFYTGISDEVDRRVAMHNAGKGAKYTRGRRPVILRYVEEVANKSEALARESEIKCWKRAKKRLLW